MLQEQREHDNMGLGRPMKCSPAYWKKLKEKEAAQGGNPVETSLFSGSSGSGGAQMGFSEGRAYLVRDMDGSGIPEPRRLELGEYASGRPGGIWEGAGGEEAVLEVEGHVELQKDMASGQETTPHTQTHAHTRNPPCSLSLARGVCFPLTRPPSPAGAARHLYRWGRSRL